MSTKNRFHNSTKSSRPSTPRPRWEQHVPELRRRILESKNIDEIFDYFLDHFAADENFLRAGHKEDNEAMTSYISAIVRVTLIQGEPTFILWTYIPEHRMWHGTFVMMPGAVVHGIWFDDMERGVTLVMRGTSSQMHFLRFAMPGPNMKMDMSTAKLIGMCRRAGSVLN